MKKTLYKMLAINIVIMSAAFTTGATAYANDTIRLGLQQVPTDALYQARDWAKPYNLKTEISTFSSGGDSLKAFLAGRVDVVSGGSARLVTIAAMQPETFYIVAANQYGGDRHSLIVAPDSTYKTIEDLKGKKIGVVAGSGGYTTFMLYLAKHKLAAKDFQLVNMKVEDIASAVNHGVLDAGQAWEPLVAIAEVSGVVKRIDSMKGINESPNFILASRTYAKEHPEGLIKYIASVVDMAHFIKATPDQAGKLIATEIGKSGVAMNPKAMELAVSRIKVDPKIEPQLINELKPLAESMLKAGRIKVMPDFTALVNESYYNKAVALSNSTPPK